MARPKKPINIDNYVKKHLRRASLYWPERAQALRNTKIAPGRWKCQGCGQICKKGEYQLDHRIPVIPLDGKIMRDTDRARIDMNKYVDRLFIPAAEWDILCIVCHESKTQVENNIRAMKRKK